MLHVSLTVNGQLTVTNVRVRVENDKVSNMHTISVILHCSCIFVHGFVYPQLTIQFFVFLFLTETYLK